MCKKELKIGSYSVQLLTDYSLPFDCKVFLFYNYEFFDVFIFSKLHNFFYALMCVEFISP